MLLTALVAVYGAVLATKSHHRAKRLEEAVQAERKERAEISRIFLGETTRNNLILKVEVVNIGHRDVSIGSVEIKGSDGVKSMAFPLTLGKKRIQPGDRALFERRVDELGDFLILDPDEAIITAYSNMGILDSKALSEFRTEIAPALSPSKT